MTERKRRHLIGARRDRAERYLLVTIVAFAVTVAATRWYLDLAGYPTIGGGDLHVAHVLWGGLALVIAVLLPMVFIGQRALLLSALLGGIGVGLFIDEVGKFLTTSNDYFYAPAAPIIYGGILVLVLLWFVVRRTRAASRHQVTHALIEALQDSVDGRLTDSRRDHLLAQADGLEPVADAAGPSVAEQVTNVLRSPAVEQNFGRQGWIESGRARQALERILPTRVERWLVVLALAWTVLQSVVAVLVLLFWDQIIVGGLQLGDSGGPLEYPSEPAWALLLLVVQVVVGLGGAAALSLLRTGRERQAMRVAAIAVLVSMVAGDLVAFYAFQIGALASTVIDLVLLGLIIDYRIRLERSPSDEEPD